MSLTPDHIIYRSEFHQHTPVQVIEFLKNDLKVSHKYVALVMGEGVEHLCKMWLRHVHLLYMIEETFDYFSYINRFVGNPSTAYGAEQTDLSALSLDADSIDTVVLLGDILPASKDALNPIQQNYLSVIHAEALVE